jgi:hypothetical protein
VLAGNRLPNHWSWVHIGHPILTKATYYSLYKNVMKKAQKKALKNEGLA